MTWLTMLLATSLQAGEPCAAPRVRDTAPLAEAAAQDKSMSLTFTKTAAICAERGPACDTARTECGAQLAALIQKQVTFDEGAWLRDMLLPYDGQQYPMTRQFPPAALAPDASCNVDAATLTAAAERRMQQATRREALLLEYGQYLKWTQPAVQRCQERVAAEEAKAAVARAEAERLAAASAAVAAAEAAKRKEAEAAAAQKADAERKAQASAEAEARRVEEAKAQAERERREAEEKAADAAAQAKREQQDAVAQAKREREEATEKAQEAQEAAAEKARLEKEAAEEQRKVEARDARVAQLRAQKAQLVADAEARLEHARTEEAAKKKAALEAVSMSPTVAQAAVGEAAQAERARIEAERALVEARHKAEAIVVDDSHERSRGSLLAAGGAEADSTSFSLGLLAGAHLGFWGVAPSDGMASGLELRLRGRFLGQLSGASTTSLDANLLARYFFGRVGLGLATEARFFSPSLSVATFAGGLALGLAVVDTPSTRILLSANYLPVGTALDWAHATADLEVSWRFLTVHLMGGSTSGVAGLGWQLGAFVGVRFGW